MTESVAPVTIAAATRSTKRPIGKLANRLLGCTCAAALWLTGSVNDLWAHEQHSHAGKHHERGPQDPSPNEQQALTKTREDTRSRVHEACHRVKQKTKTKTAQNRGSEIKSETKAGTSK